MLWYFYMEPRELLSQEKRSDEFKQFSLGIIDGRHELERKIKEKATSLSVVLNGYGRDDLRLPSFLNLPSNPNGNSGKIGFEVQTVEGESRLTKITVNLDDGAPLIIHDEEGLVIQESGDMVQILHATALNETLFSLFPENVRSDLTVNNAIDVITQLSPESSVTYEFEDASAHFLTKISISNTETVDDSIFSLEVTKTFIHPSGHLLGTRMNLSESIQRQISGADHTKNVVAIDVRPNSSPVTEPVFDLSFDTLSDNKIIPVFLPTRRHIDDIMDAVRKLDDNRFNASNTRA